MTNAKPTERLAMLVIAGPRTPQPPAPMYRTVIHTPYWGGGDNTIAAGSLIECLQTKAEFDYSIRPDAFSYSWIERWDRTVVNIPPGLTARINRDRVFGK
jgi:hypothetical protein